MNIEDKLKEIENELGEWKEELGDQFPSFLNHVLMSKLVHAYDQIEYLKKLTFYELKK